MHKTNKFRTRLFVSVLILLVLIAFEPVRHNDFVDYDDPDYITQNHPLQAGFTGSALRWAFTAGYASNWHPLTWLSHMLDVELFGLNPLGHHMHNVVLHAAAVVLLFLILHTILNATWTSFFIAAAFGLHPLRVESVAWASERKDVLSALFFMFTLVSYLYYIRRGGLWRYLLVIFCFSLGLMAKPMLVTLPILLLLLDGWPLRRFWSVSPVHLIAEKIPLFLLGLASCIITFLVQRAAGSVMPVPFSIRLPNAIISYTGYLTKLLCPIDLAVIYPYPTGAIPLRPVVISLVILIFWSVFAFYHRRKRPYLLTGWLWYLITLIPVIGLIQVGSQAMADRYTYLPSIGIFLMIACTAAELTTTWRHQKLIAGCVGGLVILAMILGTRTQSTYWKNSFALYEHTLAVTENNYIAETNMGQGLMEQQRFEEAADHILRSLQIRPDSPAANANMAFLYMAGNQPDKALEFVQRALSTKHRNAKVYSNCGLILEKTGQLRQALDAYRLAIESNPRYTEPCKNLARLLAVNPPFEGGDPAEAIQLAQKACQLTLFREPEMVKVLAAAYASAGEFEKAAETAQKAIDLALAAGQQSLADEIAAQRELYQNQQTIRKPSSQTE